MIKNLLGKYIPGLPTGMSYNLMKKKMEKICGLNRARIRDTIFDFCNYEGVTGKISWDNGGGNLVQPVLRTLTGKSSHVVNQ